MTSSFMRDALTLLSDEGSFLVDASLDALSLSLDEKQKKLVKIDAIFQSLNVESEEDIQRLVLCFVDRSDSSEGSNGGLQELKLIHPNNVNIALREFVEETKRKRDKNSKISVMKYGRNVSFWHRLADVVNHQHMATWEALSVREKREREREKARERTREKKREQQS